MKRQWFKFDWSAYQGDSERKKCSLATRGFWDELFIEMEKTDTYYLEGTIQEFAAIGSCSTAQARKCIDELFAKNAATITKCQDQCQDHVKVVSRRLLMRHNLREYNKLKKREERKSARVKSSSNSLSRTAAHTHTLEKPISGPSGFEWGYPMRQFFEFFPNCQLTPAAIGHIEAAVSTSDEEAWLRTLTLYKRNHDPTTNSYLPHKVGNVLSVFEDQKQRFKRDRERENGKNRETYQDQRARRAVDKHNAIEQVRRRVAEQQRQTEIRGSDAPDRP